MSRDQREKIFLVSKLAINFIPISEHAMNGFAYRAIMEYQVENKIEMINFETMSSEDKVRMLTNVVERIKKMLSKAIVNPEESPILEQAGNAVIDFYKKNLV